VTLQTLDSKPKACLVIQSYHLCKDTNLYTQEDVCDYFDHKLTFLPNKQLTENRSIILIVWLVCYQNLKMRYLFLKGMCWRWL